MRLKNINLRFKKTIQIVLVILFFFLQSSIFYLQSVKAASPVQSISVSPVINDLHLIPGKKTTFTITIRNNNSTPIGVHAETTGYDILGDTAQFEQKPSVMTTWTTLSENDLLINGQQTKTITAIINTPINTKQNGFYESIFLTPIYHQQETANSPIILSRFGVLVLGTVGKLNYNDLSKKVSVCDITPSYTILNSFPSSFSFTVANKYFTHFDAKPFITITPLFANSQTVELIDKHILPGSERIWRYQPSIAKNHIFYQMHMAVSVGGGNQIFADTFFIVLPYKKVLLIIAALILLYIAITRRKRLGKFMRILIKG